VKYFLKTFGCQMNFADSDEMGQHLAERGFTAAATLEDADAVLVNTCTIRDMAEHKARSYIGLLREWKEAHPERVVILTGCAAERVKETFRRRYSYVDLIVGAKDIERFPRELDELIRKNASLEERLNLDFVKAGAAPTTGQVIQNITIMRGCNYTCTYCIVPSVRGRESYRPVEDILAEVRAKVAEGGKEFWLLGQTVNSYRPPVAPRGDYDFSDLLRDVNAIDGVSRLRFSSPHPFYLTPKLIEAMADCASVC